MSLLIFVSELLMSMAFAAGFSSGNNFSTTSVSGTLSVHCTSNGQTAEAIFRCRESRLAPASSDYFLGPQGVNADTIELTVTRQDNTLRSKTMRYDSVYGKSHEKFNLWDNSFFQRPLLMDGLNKVEYKLYKQSQLLTTGQVSVAVYRNAPMACAPEDYISSDSGDCQNQVTMCGRYLEANPSCQ